MKKILLLLSVVFAMTSASAKAFAFVDKNGNEDILEWGYYSGDGSDLTGLGASGASAYKVAIYIPGNSGLAGGKINAVKIPVADGSVISSLTGWTALNLSTSMTFEAQKRVSAGEMPKGLNKDKTDVYATATFDTPFEIPASGCYVGYTITISDLTPEGGQYPLLVDQLTPNSQGCYVQIASSAWDNIGQAWGSSGLRALLSGIEMKEANATFSQIENPITAVNFEKEFDVVVNSNAGEAVTSIEYDIDIAGNKETRTADVSIPSGFNKTGVAKVKIMGPAETGSYDVKMKINKVNGKDNFAASEVTTTNFTNLSRLVERSTVMEEFTGTQCGWCPRGITAMEKLRKTFGKKFIGLAIHQYTSSDAMYFPAYRPVSISGFPSAILEGQIEVDPYYGTQKYADYIVGDVREYSSIPANVDIKLNAKWKMNQVQCDAEVEGIVEDNYTIAYVLVADSLKGKGNGWSQSNYYVQYTTTGEADLDSLWCQGGIYGTSSTHPYFMDVAISSSYNASHKNQADELGKLTFGNPVSNSYTLDLPKSASLFEQVELQANNNVYAVAIVFDSNNHIANAAKVKVEGTYEKPAAPIDGDANCDGVVDVADITTIATYILGNTPEKFSADNADANKDGKIDVADITTTAGIILYDPYNGYEYVDLGLESGLKWATCNIGGTKPQDYGNYYAWGEVATKSSYSKSNYFDSDDNCASFKKYNFNTVKELEAEDDIAHITMGGNWRIPTDAEMTELRTSCTWKKSTMNGVNGYTVTGDNGNSIFLPAAGVMDGGSVSDKGVDGNYWTSTLSSTAGQAQQLWMQYSKSKVTRTADYRYKGLTIRAVCK